MGERREFCAREEELLFCTRVREGRKSDQEGITYSGIGGEDGRRIGLRRAVAHFERSHGWEWAPWSEAKRAGLTVF